MKKEIKTNNRLPIENKLNKYIVRYSKTYDLDLEVEAINEIEAVNNADELIGNSTRQELSDKAQKGYWEQWEIEEI